MTILAATGNKGKLREIIEILGNDNTSIASLQDIGLHINVIEDGATFEENAVKKATALRQASGMNALADDSGLCVDALGGMPGVFSARFAGEKATDRDNIDKLLSLMKDKEDRRAKFVCVIALALTDGRLITARGECQGLITSSPSGTRGFGYDPVFLDEASGKTFAELPQDEKNMISHRKKALEAVRDMLKERDFGCPCQQG